MEQILIDKRKKTETQLTGIKNLPLIPKVMFEVTKLLKDPSLNTNSLANVIAKDQGLTAKILSIANSPLYGVQRKVTSLEFAVVVLGFKEIGNVVTAVSLADAIKVTPDKNFDPVDFWIHSMLVGTAARGISRELGHAELGSDAFVAGVLHEIGIQILHKFMHKDFSEIVSKVALEDKHFLDVENEILGITHEEIGKFLGEKWNLPQVLCDVLNHHHHPGESTLNKELTAIVHLADFMTQALQAGTFYWDNNMDLDKSVIKILGFSSETDLSKFILNYKDLFIQTANSIRI